MELRQKVLEQLDAWIDLITPYTFRTFSVYNPEEPITLQSIPFLEQFSHDHGFFSCHLPLIGVVSEESRDIIPVQKALLSLQSYSFPSYIDLAVAEILSKAMAYRALKKGMIIHIPSQVQGQIHITEYQVDSVIDLWHEMPAFGLTPTKAGSHHPLLLFRGTDLSLLSKRSWASLLSDLDLSGSGFSTFHFARPDLHQWLLAAYKKTGKKTKTMGFSLGGALALYTTLFESDLIADTGSFAFNLPGLPQNIASRFKKTAKNQISLIVTQGDIIPKIGTLPTPATVLSTKEKLLPIAAHTNLMVSQHVLYISSLESDSPSEGGSMSLLRHLHHEIETIE